MKVSTVYTTVIMIVFSSLIMSTQSFAAPGGGKGSGKGGAQGQSLGQGKNHQSSANKTMDRQAQKLRKREHKELGSGQQIREQSESEQQFRERIK